MKPHRMQRCLNGSVGNAKKHIDMETFTQPGASNDQKMVGKNERGRKVVAIASFSLYHLVWN